MTQLHGLSRLHPSRSVVNACHSFATTNSNSAERYTPFSFGSASNPLMEDLQEGCPFGLFEPYCFVYAVKAKTKEAFGCLEGPFALAKFLGRNWVHGVVFAWWKDIVYPMENPPCYMLHLLFCGRDDASNEIVHICLKEISQWAFFLMVCCDCSLVCLCPVCKFMRR